MTQFQDFLADSAGFFRVFLENPLWVPRNFPSNSQPRSQETRLQPQEETQMFVLVIHVKETGETKRFVSQTMKPLNEVLAMFTEKFGLENLAWRRWNRGWSAGSDEAWQLIHDHRGPAAII